MSPSLSVALRLRPALGSLRSSENWQQRGIRELFNSLLGFRYLPHRGTLLKRLSAAARFRFRNDVSGSGKRFRKKPMILPHDFRRLRLAECSVKPRQATPNSVASSAGTSSSHRARGRKESAFTCSDRAVLQRKLEQLAEGGHGGAGNSQRVPFWTRQRPRGISFGVVAERRLFRAQGYRTMDSGINSSTPARCIF